MTPRKSSKVYSDAPQTPPAGGERSMSAAEREQLVLEYLPLVKYHAGRMKMRIPSHIEMDDLVSSGIVGLLDALDRFDPSRGIKFKTYAEFRIRGTMLDYLREMDWFPRSLRQRAVVLQHNYTQLEVLLGRPPTDEEVAENMNIPLEELRKEIAMLSGLTVFSLDTQSDNETDSGISRILAKAAIDEAGEEEFLRDLKEVLGKAIDLLPDNERQLIAFYYYEELTMKEIGTILSLGEPRICQLHNQAVLRLRGKLARQLVR